MSVDTDVGEFITDLDGGVFASKLGRILSDVAGSVVDHNRPGNVTIKIDIRRIGTSYQVALKHKLSYERPTMRGKQREEDVTETPMHVGKGGRLTMFPEQQTQMFDKKGAIAGNQE